MANKPKSTRWVICLFAFDDNGEHSQQGSSAMMKLFRRFKAWLRDMKRHFDEDMKS